MIGKSGQGTRCSFLVWIAQLAIYLFKQKQKKNIWTFILFIYFFDGILCLHETDGGREMTRSEGWEKWGKANKRANNILFNNSWTLRFFTCHLDLCQFFGSHLLPSKLWCSLVEFEFKRPDLSVDYSRHFPIRIWIVFHWQFLPFVSLHLDQCSHP